MPSFVRADQSGRGRADRPVAAADDQQRVAAFGDRPAPHLAFAAPDQLDLGGHAGPGERLSDLLRNLRVRRGPRRRRG